MRAAYINGYWIKLNGCFRQMKTIFCQVLTSEADLDCLQHLRRSSLWQWLTLKVINFCHTEFVRRLPSKHLLVLKTAWIRLQHVFSVTIFRLPRRLEDLLQRRLEDVLKTSWRHLTRPLDDVLADEKLLRWRRL